MPYNSEGPNLLLFLVDATILFSHLENVVDLLAS
jgi:hypothetical protein